MSLTLHTCKNCGAPIEINTSDWKNVVEKTREIEELRERLTESSFKSNEDYKTIDQLKHDKKLLEIEIKNLKTKNDTDFYNLMQDMTNQSALYEARIEKLKAELRTQDTGQKKTTVGGEVYRESVCQEADRLVSGEKREEYGDPKSSLDRAALMWSGILGIQVTGAQVALCMIALKIGREMHAHKRDNLVDICGYAKLLELYYEETK